MQEPLSQMSEVLDVKIFSPFSLGDLLRPPEGGGSLDICGYRTYAEALRDRGLSSDPSLNGMTSDYGSLGEVLIFEEETLMVSDIRPAYSDGYIELIYHLISKRTDAWFSISEMDAFEVCEHER